MKILLLGANGQVGWELARSLPTLGELSSTTRDGKGAIRLDLTDLLQLQKTLDAEQPDVIVNAAAYTAVDKAESEVDLAMRLNAEVPKTIARWAVANKATLFHYSTDYVFDGTKSGPYVETDTPNPINTYGRSKLAGDEAVLDSGCDSVILRVSWVYGLRGSNFLLTMRRLMAERDELSIVNDQLGAPTWSRSIAEVTTNILSNRGGSQPGAVTGGDVFHYAPMGCASWYDFALAIRDRLHLTCAVHSIPAEKYPTIATRPANSIMDTGKLQGQFALPIHSWEDDLDSCLV